MTNRATPNPLAPSRPRWICRPPPIYSGSAGHRRTNWSAWGSGPHRSFGLVCGLRSNRPARSPSPTAASCGWWCSRMRPRCAATWSRCELRWSRSVRRRGCRCGCARPGCGAGSCRHADPRAGSIRARHIRPAGRRRAVPAAAPSPGRRRAGCRGTATVGGGRVVSGLDYALVQRLRGQVADMLRAERRRRAEHGDRSGGAGARPHRGTPRPRQANSR